jgi:hypothetical protein
MNDMTPVIVPKSDQISADDFIAGPKTYTIEEIEIRPGTEQPVSIFLAGETRAWKPCKSMSRCLVAAWGPDANVYKGRSVTLYRDPKVKWGGMEVGGIRISHMTNIEREMLLQLTATKGKRNPHVVKPLIAEVTPIDAGKQSPAQKWATAYIAKLAEITTSDELNAFANEKAKKLSELEGAAASLHRDCIAALDKRRAELAGFADDTFEEGKPIEDTGEGFTDDEAPYAATVADIMARIDKAMGEASFEAAKAEYTKHMMALPKDVCAPIEAALQAKKGELGL